MRNLRIAFLDFWAGFDPKDNFIFNVLKQKYSLEIVKPEEQPEILFYSFFGQENLKYRNPIRVYFTGENDVPNFNLCDYAISFHEINFGKRHLRLPLYVIYGAFQNLINGRSLDMDVLKRNFCSFVVSNNWSADPIRSEFFQRLSEYKIVASGGRYANNVGGPVLDKMLFLKSYKFNIAFENSQVAGYTTEKIIEAFAAGTVPIYWGDPDICKDINKDSFIDVSSFSSIDEAIEHIKRVDEDDELYLSILNANPLKNNRYVKWQEILLEFVENIVETGGKLMPYYGIGGNQMFVDMRKKEQLFSELSASKWDRVKICVRNLLKCLDIK